MAHSDSKWEQRVTITSMEYGCVGKPLFNNKNDIIISIGKYGKEISSIIRYDQQNDECVPLIEFDQQPLQCAINSICIDQDRNIIYAPSTEGIHQIDLSTKTNQQILYKELICESSIFVDDKVYIFGWNVKNRNIQSVFDPNTFSVDCTKMKLYDARFLAHCVSKKHREYYL